MTFPRLRVNVCPEKSVGTVAAIGLHTLAVYLCSMHFSPWLIGRWFAWLLPVFHISTTITPGDWYLRHLEAASILPAAFAGYVTARRPDSVATWAWGVPMVVLCYKMVQYQLSSSVLIGMSMSAVTYFFEIEHVMPTLTNLTAVDPVRVLEQMTTTAPFYAGMAYSLGAWIAKRQLQTALMD